MYTRKSHTEAYKKGYKFVCRKSWRKPVVDTSRPYTETAAESHYWFNSLATRALKIPREKQSSFASKCSSIEFNDILKLLI